MGNPRAVRAVGRPCASLGELIGERRVPSEKLLMWLLARLDPNRFAAPWERRAGDETNPQRLMHGAFPALLADLTDTAET